jgi:hypothetical protein
MTEVGRRLVADVEHDLAITHMFSRDARAGVDSHGEVGGKTVVAAPLVNGAYQVRLGRRQSHICPHNELISRAWSVGRRGHGKMGRCAYLRMAFSEGVSASMKPWRLKIRSPYFIRGAAALDSSIP